MMERLIDEDVWLFMPSREWVASMESKNRNADGVYFEGLADEYLFIRVMDKQDSVSDILKKLANCTNISHENWSIIGTMRQLDKKWLRRNHPEVYNFYFHSMYSWRQRYCVLTRFKTARWCK